MNANSDWGLSIKVSLPTHQPMSAPISAVADGRITSSFHEVHPTPECPSRYSSWLPTGKRIALMRMRQVFSWRTSFIYDFVELTAIAFYSFRQEENVPECCLLLWNTGPKVSWQETDGLSFRSTSCKQYNSNDAIYSPVFQYEDEWDSHPVPRSSHSSLSRRLCCFSFCINDIDLICLILSFLFIHSCRFELQRETMCCTLLGICISSKSGWWSTWLYFMKRRMLEGVHFSRGKGSAVFICFLFNIVLEWSFLFSSDFHGRRAFQNTPVHFLVKADI